MCDLAQWFLGKSGVWGGGGAQGPLDSIQWYFTSYTQIFTIRKHYVIYTHVSICTIIATCIMCTTSMYCVYIYIYMHADWVDLCLASDYTTTLNLKFPIIATTALKRFRRYTIHLLHGYGLFWPLHIHFAWLHTAL